MPMPRTPRGASATTATVQPAAPVHARIARARHVLRLPSKPPAACPTPRSAPSTSDRPHESPPHARTQPPSERAPRRIAANRSTTPSSVKLNRCLRRTGRSTSDCSCLAGACQHRRRADRPPNPQRAPCTRRPRWAPVLGHRVPDLGGAVVRCGLAALPAAPTPSNSTDRTRPEPPRQRLPGAGTRPPNRSWRGQALFASLGEGVVYQDDVHTCAVE